MQANIVLKHILLVLSAVFASVALAQADEFEGDEYYDQGVHLYEAGKYREAIPYFTKAIELDARNADAFSDRAHTWVMLGENEKAIADANQAIRLMPNDSVPYAARGLAWYGKGENDKAIADFNQAIRFVDDTLDPAEYYADRARAWHSKGELDKATADFDKAIELDRTNNHHYFTDRANAWNAKGSYEKALRDFKEAVRLDPRDADAANALAWLQATCPDANFRDGQAAFRNASQAYQLSGGKNADHIDTLAAAYAETGAFDLAREWQAKAIELAPEQSKADLRARLELYKQDKPFRAEPPKQ